MSINMRVLLILGCVLAFVLLTVGGPADWGLVVSLAKTVVAAIFFILLIPILPFLVDTIENGLGMEYDDPKFFISAPAPSTSVRVLCPGCGHIDVLERIDSAWHCSNCKRAFVSWRSYVVK